MNDYTPNDTIIWLWEFSTTGDPEGKWRDVGVFSSLELAQDAIAQEMKECHNVQSLEWKHSGASGIHNGYFFTAHYPIYLEIEKRYTTWYARLSQMKLDAFVRDMAADAS